MSTLPLADARRLITLSRPGQVAASALALLAGLLSLAFLFASRDSHSHTLVPLKSNADNVLVLDLSASISSDTYSRIAGTLRALSGSGRKFGLVVFSDEAYEALPPGTPAADLAPLVRYFTLPPQKTPGFLPTYPPNPWQRRFTAGTNLSAGLELAHRIALEGPHRATVVLVSDLSDSPGDLTRLASILLAYGRDGVPIRIVGLNPAPADVAFFRQLLPAKTPVVAAPTLEQSRVRESTPFPWVLVALAAATALALCLLAAWRRRLEWSVA
jgi:hypothetical protein